MTKRLWWLLGSALGMVIAIVVGCAAPKQAPQTVPPTPTAYPLSRTNPNIIEEDEVHIVERFPKDQYIRVDDRHIRNPIIGPAVEFFKEDDKYYYVYTFKRSAELNALSSLEHPAATPAPASAARSVTPTGPPAADFEDLLPPRVSGRLHLEEVKNTGLPTGGQWRASFVMADMNGDGILDIVAPAARVGNNLLHIWIGDGHGHFSAWPIATVEDGKTKKGVAVGYGSVAVGDIDGDGNLDIVAAQHNGGLASFFGDGHGNFRPVRTGLPGGGFSSQAIVLLDANGDGKLDIVASRDIPATRDASAAAGSGPDERQVRVYLWGGKRGWTFNPAGLIGGFYSDSMRAWDFDRDGRLDVLTGSHYLGALTLLWRNKGDGTFEPVMFPEIEGYALHFATADGTFGKERFAAFADSYASQFADGDVMRKAMGITVYSFDATKWSRHRVWRKKAGRSVQYALAMGDIDGDGLDDIVFPDTDTNRLRVFFQQPDGSFVEAAETEEPVIDSTVQCVRLADVDGDGRLDIVLSKTISSFRSEDKGGWAVYLNRSGIGKR